MVAARMASISPADLVVGLALHAQRDQEYPRLHRIGLAVQDELHAVARLRRARCPC